jgi:hypothetical protein
MEPNRPHALYSALFIEHSLIRYPQQESKACFGSRLNTTFKASFELQCRRFAGLGYNNKRSARGS